MAIKTPTQSQMIRHHLEEFGSIEPLTALREYGVYRLGAVIFNLIHEEGMNIESHKMKGRSHITGRPVQFARYILIKQPQEGQK